MPRDWFRGAPSSSTSTSEGFIGSPEIADGELITRHFRASAVNAAALSTDSVTTDKITDANVTSCKISTNALTRTVVIGFPKLTACFGANLTSAFVVYQPIIPMQITGIQVTNYAAMENSTADKIVLFRNSSSCVGVTGWTSISTAVALGSLSCVGSINNAAIAANTPITMQTIFSTCSVSSAGNLILHFTSTG